MKLGFILSVLCCAEAALFNWRRPATIEKQPSADELDQLDYEADLHNWQSLQLKLEERATMKDIKRTRAQPRTQADLRYMRETERERRDSDEEGEDHVNRRIIGQLIPSLPAPSREADEAIKAAVPMPADMKYEDFPGKYSSNFKDWEPPFTEVAIKISQWFHQQKVQLALEDTLRHLKRVWQYLWWRYESQHAKTAQAHSQATDLVSLHRYLQQLALLEDRAQQLHKLTESLDQMDGIINRMIQKQQNSQWKVKRVKETRKKVADFVEDVKDHARKDLIAQRSQTSLLKDEIQAVTKELGGKEGLQRMKKRVERQTEKRKLKEQTQGARKRRRLSADRNQPIGGDEDAEIADVLKNRKKADSAYERLQELEEELAEAIEPIQPYKKYHNEPQVRSIYPINDGPFVWIPEEILINGPLVPENGLSYKKNAMEEADYLLKEAAQRDSKIAASFQERINPLKQAYTQAQDIYLKALLAVNIMVKKANERAFDDFNDPEDELEKIMLSNEFKACAKAKQNLTMAELGLLDMTHELEVNLLDKPMKLTMLQSFFGAPAPSPFERSRNIVKQPIAGTNATAMEVDTPNENSPTQFTMGSQTVNAARTSARDKKRTRRN